MQTRGPIRRATLATEVVAPILKIASQAHAKGLLVLQIVQKENKMKTGFEEASASGVATPI